MGETLLSREDQGPATAVKFVGAQRSGTRQDNHFKVTNDGASSYHQKTCILCNGLLRWWKQPILRLATPFQLIYRMKWRLTV